ncbi:hypothetical protein LPB72_23000 [Hydrogenophaga crassostreae]|uniref:DUF3108 domain-containing protein n=3 Tax=Hydrogenophaga crassostreae TaxID=1763535 RepID=A0A167G9Z2_9BURK|nr:hypothetical protein LPB072_00725 [Hydrogenophaga crassostreae]OAD39167.1 hypothetical protein LPB72_23000 [Hydrogenophaga crassostreae]
MMDDIVATAVPEPATVPAPTPPQVADVVVEPATAVAVAPPTEPRVAKPASGPTVPEGSLPTNATLSYDVKGRAKGFNYSAGGTLSWQQTGNTYKADLEISAFLLGSFQRISTGLITEQGLVPQRFVDRRRNNEKTAVFDRDAGVIRYSKKTPDAALLPGAQDQLSVMLQLAGLLNARQQLVEGDVISVPVSSDSDAEVWRFEIGAVETLRLPAGDVTARRLIRQPRKPNDKTVEVWLAPNLGRLPVRMRLTEPNGDFMDQLLEDMPEMVSEPNPAQENPKAVP